MKIVKKNMKNIDPIYEASKDPRFESYVEAAKIRGRIGMEVFFKKKRTEYDPARIS